MPCTARKLKAGIVFRYSPGDEIAHAQYLSCTAVCHSSASAFRYKAGISSREAGDRAILAARRADSVEGGGGGSGVGQKTHIAPPARLQRLNHILCYLHKRSTSMFCVATPLRFEEGAN